MGGIDLIFLMPVGDLRHPKNKLKEAHRNAYTVVKCIGEKKNGFYLNSFFKAIELNPIKAFISISN